jgi:tetratricopeptide (TPR) repeat protein
VAVKLIHRKKAEDEPRHEREARLQMSLGTAEGFVPLLDSGELPEGPYLVMPFLPGGTLRERVDQGPLSPPESVALVATLARALGRAHERGIVHRDLKPDNVLFDESGRPLVADLGLAKHFRRDVLGASQSAALSRSGELRGSAGYMAPEQQRDASTSRPEADVFALGAILYECLTGLPAFSGESLVDVLGKVDRGEYEPLASASPEAPAWVAAIVERALATDPGKRFQDGHALANALDAGRGVRRRHPARYVLALAAILAILVPAGVAVERARRATLVETRCATGESFTRAGDALRAIGAFDQALEANPRSTRALLGRAEAFRLSRRPDRAIPDLNQAILLEPGLARAWKSRSWAKSALGDAEGAIADATRALALDPGLSTALEALAEAHTAKRDYRAALADYSQLLETRSGVAKFWANRGGMRAYLGDDAGAIEDEGWALELDPGLAPTWLNRGFSRAALGDFEGAIADCTRALELAPLTPAALCNRASARRQAGDLAGALADCTRALELAPQQLEAYKIRARTRLVTGDRRGAVADFKMAIALDPGHGADWFELAQALDGLKDAEAREDYDKASALAQPRSPLHEAVSWTGITQLDLGQLPTETALARFEAESARAAAPARGLLRRALIEAASGRDAAAAFAAASTAAPADPVVALARARWLVGRERLDEAGPALETARRLGADDHEVARLEGDRLWRLGKLPEAAAAFGKLGREDPSGRAGSYALAALALLQEDTAPARKRLEAAIAKWPDAPEIFRLYAYGEIVADIEGSSPIGLYDELVEERLGVGSTYALQAIDLEGVVDLESLFLRDLGPARLLTRVDPDASSFDRLRQRFDLLAPSSGRYAFLLGRVALAWEDPARPLDERMRQRATACFDEAARRAPERGLRALGLAILALKDGLALEPGATTWHLGADALASAKTHLARARRVEPGCWIPAYWMRQLVRDDPAFAKTLELAKPDPGEPAKSVVRLGPDRLRALRERTSIRERRGDHKGAIADATLMIELEPANGELWNVRGWNRALAGDFDGAIADCTKAIQLSPRQANTFHSRGWAHARKGDHGAAVADFSRAIELEPSLPWPWRDRGRERDLGGDVRGALEDLGRFLELAPADPDAATVRARIAELEQKK